MMNRRSLRDFARSVPTRSVPTEESRPLALVLGMYKYMLNMASRLSRVENSLPCGHKVPGPSDHLQQVLTLFVRVNSS